MTSDVSENIKATFSASHITLPSGKSEVCNIARLLENQKYELAGFSKLSGLKHLNPLSFPSIQIFELSYPPKLFYFKAAGYYQFSGALVICLVSLIHAPLHPQFQMKLRSLSDCLARSHRITAARCSYHGDCHMSQRELGAQHPSRSRTSKLFGTLRSPPQN